MEERTSALEKLVSRIKENSKGKACYFRGESKCFDDVSSKLHRTTKEKGEQEENSIYVAGEIETAKIQERMLDNIRKKALFAISLDDNAILAELRHFGYQTNIIDFTYDCLVAIFFACRGKSGENGRIIIVDEEKITKNNCDIIKPKTSSFLNASNRILSQKSVFIIPKIGKLEKEDIIEIEVLDEQKVNILKDLAKFHGIENATLFNDLFGIYEQEETHWDAASGIESGLAKNKSKEYKDAVDIFSKVIAKYPDLAEAYFYRSIAYRAQGMLVEAAKDLDEAISLTPSISPSVYNDKGVFKAILGKSEEAIKEFDEAIRLDPENAVAYYNRGNAKVALGKHEEAVKDFDEAIRLDPKYTSAFNNRGIAKVALDKHEEAVKDYDEAIRLEPENAAAYNNRGNAKFALGKLEEAVNDFDEAVRLEPENAECYNSRGNIKFALGKLEEAKGYNSRDSIKVALGMLEEAVKDFDEAIRLDPSHALAYTNRGKAKAALANMKSPSRTSMRRSV